MRYFTFIQNEKLIILPYPMIKILLQNYFNAGIWKFSGISKNYNFPGLIKYPFLATNIITNLGKFIC